jgi:preprotein translocase subunit SecA
MWDQWAYAADALYPEDLLPELRAAFDADRIDTMCISIKDIEYSLQLGREHVLGDLRRRNHYMNDAAADLERWACFRRDGDLETNQYPFLEPYPYRVPHPDTVPLPYFRAAPKVGRNDPCPCGSGKKYKKCCMPA